MLIVSTGFALAQTDRGRPEREIWLLEIEGVINPLTHQYLERHIRAASRVQRVEALVLRLNTPGGLESSMREMVQALLNAPVPVIVYVAPGGARAASAGMFITIAANIAAMAPGTNIGAAHPVALGGDGGDEVGAAKVVNDAAALARAVAIERGRNARWAEQAVRESVSITASEALRQDVIDLVAADLTELMRALEGRSVKTREGEVHLTPAGARLVRQPMNFAERALHTITDPNIAYLLFMVGFIGIIAELYSPGMLFPGVIGAISMLLAFASLGSLPLGWAGVALLVLGIGLSVVDLMTEGIGFLAVGGLIAFVLGSLMLYTPLTPVSPALPAVDVSPWLIGVMTAVFLGFFLIVGRALVGTRRLPVATGVEALRGKGGIVVQDIDPIGRVRVDNEEWSAELDPTSQPGPIHQGESVIVTDAKGVTLKVKQA